MFYGISSVELRRLVFDYAEKNGIPHPFHRAARLARQDWLHGFLKQNPRMNVRKPEATSISQITAFNKEEVDLFSPTLHLKWTSTSLRTHKYIIYRDLHGSITGNSFKPEGTKQVGAATSWENSTVGCAISAAGEYIPPMFIFPRQRMSPNLAKGGPPNAIYHCSHNEWITEDLFITWLHHFISYAKPTKEQPVLLVTDNHKTHTTLAA